MNEFIHPNNFTVKTFDKPTLVAHRLLEPRCVTDTVSGARNPVNHVRTRDYCYDTCDVVIV